MTQTSGTDRHATRYLLREVRSRIWAWDPIGVAETGAPDDEYDCLLGPVINALRQGLAPHQLATLLRTHVADHFGVEPIGTEDFSIGIVAWYGASGVPAAE